MPIWSLTKERVDKLLQQIGDKEAEVDALIKLTKEDLWNKDLDEFIQEWRFQLEEEVRVDKKLRSMGRRASSKLKLGGKAPMARKRKAQGEDPDDSDFGVAKPQKPAAINRVQPKSGMLAHLTKPAVPTKAPVKDEVDAKPINKPAEDDWMQIDGSSDAGQSAPAPKRARAAVAKRATTVVKNDEDLTDDDDVKLVKPVAARQPRAAARKVINYGGSDESDGDNGDDLLGDVSKMVKGIGGGAAEPTNGSRPLFSASMSRPGSSAGLPKSNSKPSKLDVGFSDDETDYSKLAPPPSRTSAGITTKEITLDLNTDGDDSLAEETMAKPISKPTKAVSKPVTKPLPKPRKAPTKKAASAPAAVSAPPKKIALSPAAKAYAAKHNRAGKRRVVDSDDDEGDEVNVDAIANDLLDSPVAGGRAMDDEDSPVRVPARAAAAPVAGRPSRRAAATVKKPAYVVDDDDSEEASSVADVSEEEFSDSE